MSLNQSYKALIQAYTEYLQTLGFAPTTCYNYPLFVLHFLAWVQQTGIHHLQHLTAKVVRDYFAYLETKRGQRTGRPFSTAHLNMQFLAIDKFLEFLHHSGMTGAPAPLKYSLETVRQKPLQVLTTGQVKHLYVTVPLTFADMDFAKRRPRQMALQLCLDLCYGCGLRRSEAVNVQLNDINFDTRVLHVRQGKNYKDRFVPMSRQVYDHLQTFTYQWRRCFNRPTGLLPDRRAYLYPFIGQTLANDLKHLLQHGNNPRIQAKAPTLHTLRHSIATHLLQNGMSIENIALFLGHSTLDSTQIYTHIINDL